MNKVKIISIFIALSLTCACEKWLDVIPPQGLIREEFWKTKEDVQAVIMGSYEKFASMDDLLFKFGEIRADMVVGDVNQSDNERKIAEGNIYPDNDCATGRPSTW